MAFDAGEIQARLVLNRDQFDRDLRAAKAEAAKPIEQKVNVEAATKQANADLDKTKAKADDLGTKSPTVKVKADTAKANADLDKTKAKADSLGKSLSDGLGKAPWWAGPALASLPAVSNLLGVAAGASAALGATFATGGIALAAYGLTAKSVLTGASKAASAVEKAQNTYNASIKAGAKQATAYAAEQKAISLAYAQMSPQQIALSKQLGVLSDSWQGVQKSVTPVIALSVSPWLKGITAGMGFLKPVVTDVGAVIGDLGRQFDSLVKGPSFATFMGFIGSEGSQVVGAGGTAILDFLHGFIILLPEFTPLIDDVNRGISNLGASFLTWAESDKSRADIQHFMAYLTTNGPGVGSLLKNIAGALTNLGSGLGAGGAAEIRVISDFFGVIAHLPKSFVAPVTDLAAGLLLISKFGFGKKIISVGVDFVGQAATTLLKWLTGGAIDLTGKFSADAGMQRAADTMVVAAGSMQRAADTMVGGGAAAGAGGAAGEGAAGGAAVSRGSSVLAGLGPAVLAVIAAVVGKEVLQALIGKQNAQTVGRIGTASTSQQALALDPGFQHLVLQVMPKWRAAVSSFFGVAVDVVKGTPPPKGKTPPPVKPQGPASYEDHTATETGPAVPKLDAAQYANLKQIAAMYGITLPAAYKLTQTATFNLAQSENDQSKAAQAANLRLSAAAAILQVMHGNTGQAQKAMDAYTTSFRLNGAVSSATQAARQRLITDLEHAGLTAAQADAAVTKLTAGIRSNSSFYDQTHPARQKLIDDLTKAGFNSAIASSEVNKLTMSVIETGKKSQGTASARASLIRDFEEAGLNAKAATALVDGFIRKLAQVKSPPPVVIQVSAEGQWHISSGGTGGGGFRPTPSGHAAGWRVPGYGSGDIVPALLEPGETVVPKYLTPAVAPLMAAHGVPGFATGGVVGSYKNGLPGEESWQGREYAATIQAVEAATAAAATAGIKAAAAKATGGLGKASLRQIEDWWMGAGGPGGFIAHIAAAITGAESGFNTGAVQQGQPYATTGWGLWQITPGNSEPQFGVNQALLNGPSNAGAAVAKYHGAGGFSPWTTFMDGAYLKFMASGGTAEPGWAMVGERGPELVRMTGGETVLPHAESMMHAIPGMRGYAAGTLGGGGSGTGTNSKLSKDTAALHKDQNELAALQRRAAAHVKGLRVPLDRDELYLLENPGLPAEKKKILEAAIKKQEKDIRDYRAKATAEEDKLAKEIRLLQQLIKSDGSAKPGKAPAVGKGSKKQELAELAKDVTALAKEQKAAAAKLKELRRPLEEEELYLLTHPGLSASSRAALEAEIKKREKAIAAYRAKVGVSEGDLSKEISLLRALTGYPTGAQYGGAGGTTATGTGTGTGTTTATTTPPGKFVGMTPTPPQSAGGSDFIGGGSGGLGGSAGSAVAGSAAAAAMGLADGSYSLGAGSYSIGPAAGQPAAVTAYPGVSTSSPGMSGGNVEKLLTQLVAAARQSPSLTGGHLAQALNGTARTALSRATWNTR